ncbi:hypothetical protein [Nocardia sp. NPDC057030]|uniref:hypothetical protein n=1 Tax=unclassified Nocardia TaxID=2637762 RepID=UPI00363E575A
MIGLRCGGTPESAFDRPQILTAAIGYSNAPRSCAWHEPLAYAMGMMREGRIRMMHVRTENDGLTQNPPLRGERISRFVSRASGAAKSRRIRGGFGAAVPR